MRGRKGRRTSECWGGTDERRESTGHRGERLPSLGDPAVQQAGGRDDMTSHDAATGAPGIAFQPPGWPWLGRIGGRSSTNCGRPWAAGSDGSHSGCVDRPVDPLQDVRPSRSHALVRLLPQRRVEVKPGVF